MWSLVSCMLSLKEKIAVRGVIERYLDAWQTNNVEEFKRLFHENFLMVGHRSEGVTFSGIEPMLPKVNSSSARWENYSVDICHIDVAGPIASVTLEEYGFLDIDALATSYFQLIKQDNSWLIVSKTYTFQR